MSVVFITYSSERERERDHCCVKDYIEMPTRFHSWFVHHKSMWLKRLLTLKPKKKRRSEGRCDALNILFPSFEGVIPFVKIKFSSG